MSTTDQETEAIRSMTPAQKLAVMNALIRQAFELKVAAVRARWPDLSEVEIRERSWKLVCGDDT